MDIHYSADDLAFQAEVKAFLRDNLDAALAARVAAGAELTRAEMEGWHATLNARGWVAGHWPREAGGQGWGAVQRHIFDEECALANAPRIVPFGVNMLGPVLLAFGTPGQQAHYLPRILDDTDWWCQGYSEPGAGSDLASLRTRAVREGDDYVINGQKTWTTLGQHANRIFCLVRTATEGKPQEGISFILVDLDTPGIEMRPIRLIEGGYEVNEVFFTDVRVPVTNLVGKENQGWTIAKYLLGHERTSIVGVGFNLEAFERVRTMARNIRRGGRRLIEDPLFAARLAQIEIDLEALKLTNLRMLAAAEGKGQLGDAPSMLKIKGTVIRQALNDLARRALGPAAAPFPSEALEGNLALAAPEHAAAAADYFNNRKLSIFGGSNEIQRNIVAKGLLGA
ncbi:MAG: acyl-CoA dehydrogenase family protein [Rhodobacteraceae bacterium]|nr:acyl-CoA dehydrogenase family protein [Paracoccaceae bacterium]